MIDGVNVLDYIFTTARGSTLPPHDFGVVAVIDGETVKVTPFRAANVPPPMALHSITAHSNVTDVALNWDASSVAILHQKGISIFEWKPDLASASPPILTGRIIFQKTSSAKSFQQVCFDGKDEVLALQRGEFGSTVRRYGFNEETGMDEKGVEDNTSLSITTVSSFNKDDTLHAYLQHTSGGLLRSISSGQESLSGLMQNMTVKLPWLEIIPYGGNNIAFGMSSNGHLYANGRLLVKNCTSFLVTPAHLIFTTTTHLLKFVHITNVNGIFLL